MASVKLTISFFILFIVISNSASAQWVQSGLNGKTVNALAISGNNIFAGASTFANPFGIYLSTNNGATWNTSGLDNRTVISLAISGNYIFAGTSSFGVSMSTNNGLNWSQTSLNNRVISSLAIIGNNIFAGSIDISGLNGVYISPDNGSNWTQTSLNNQSVRALVVSGTNVLAGTTPNVPDTIPHGVYISTNNGANWTQTSLNNQYVSSLALNGNNIIAGTGVGVFVSTNNGLNWIQTPLNNQSISSLIVNGNSIFTGTFSNNFYLSNNNGTNWIIRNEGLGSGYIGSFCILNNFIFAGTSLSGVYRRPLSELVGIQPISNEFPSSFSLSQNYPNPFNPTTKIKFNIPSAGQRHAFDTRLTIYNILGEEVAVLVNEQLNPGTYEVDFDGSNYSSGVYYYKLIAGENTNNGGRGDYTETKKMVLIK